MMKVQNYQQTKTYLKDLVGMHEQPKSNPGQKSIGMGWMQDSSPKSPNNLNNIAYDQFMYTDKLTKKKIRMGDAKTSYQKGRLPCNNPHLESTYLGIIQQKKKRQSRMTRHKSNFQLQKQLTDLNECFLMLKSTQMFKLNSLKQRIFGSVDRLGKSTSRNSDGNLRNNQTVEEEIRDVLAKKKKIRQILQDSMKQANIKQFRNYFNKQNHKINHKIIAMNRHIPRSFNKTNIQKIISTLESVDKKDATCRLIRKPVQDGQFPGQEKLRTDLIDYMRKHIKQNGEYLVTPQKKKLLFQKLYNNVTLKSGLKTQGSQQPFATNNLQNQRNSIPDQSQFCDSQIEINIQSDKNIFNQNNVSDYNNTSGQKHEQVEIIRTTMKKVKFGQRQSKQRKQKHKKDKTCINFQTYANKQNKHYSKPSQISSFLKQFKFSSNEKSGEICTIKDKFYRNVKLTTKRYSLKEQRFLFLVENGLLFDVEKQILMNEDYLFIKNKNQDNLLHICAKNHYTEMLSFIVERYKKCNSKKEFVCLWGERILKDKLTEKNKNNKNVLQVAKLYQAQQIIQMLLKHKDQLSILEYGS